MQENNNSKHTLFISAKKAVQINLKSNYFFNLINGAQSQLLPSGVSGKLCFCYGWTLSLHFFAELF